MENSSNIDKPSSSSSSSPSFAQFQITLLRNFDYIKNQQQALFIEAKNIRQQLNQKQQQDLTAKFLKTHFKTEQIISIINHQLIEIKEDLDKIKEEIKEIQSLLKK